MQRKNLSLNRHLNKKKSKNQGTAVVPSSVLFFNVLHQWLHPRRSVHRSKDLVNAILPTSRHGEPIDTRQRTVLDYVSTSGGRTSDVLRVFVG